jgi:hypothetical protein
MMDSDHNILKYFHHWSQKIINHGAPDSGQFNEVNGRYPYEIGYKDEYSTRIVIRHYSNESFDNKYYEIILERAFPIVIGDVELAWENNDTYLTLPVSFSYDKISFSGAKSGTPTLSISRGNGLLDRIGAVLSLGSVIDQTVSQGVKFDSIQDAINRVSRVRNSFDNIDNRI